MKKKKIRPFNIFLCILLVISIYMMYEGLLEEIIPHSRKLFWSYESFYKHTERISLKEDMPESAHNLKYYIYEGLLHDKCGYRVVLSEADYETVKKERINFYSKNFNSANKYSYKGTKEYASLEQMQSQRIDFLDELIPEEEVSQYYFLCYYIYDSSEYTYAGVLCNDETCEMVEFGVSGPN